MNIYVGNLSPDVTEDTLKSAFEEFGEVESVKIIKDKFTGEPRGFGFVDMKNEEEAQGAISNMNGQELNGQKLRVSEANKPEDRGSRFGGGGPNRGKFNRNRGGFGNGGGNGGSSNGGGFRKPRY